MSNAPATMDQVLHQVLLLTRKGTIKWSPDELVERRIDSLVGRAYSGDFKTSRFALYEYRYKHYVDEDDWTWTFNVAFELVDRKGTMLWEVQSREVQGELRELLNEVRTKSAGVETLFSQLMDEDVE